MKTLQYFKQIASIPHCSFNTQELRDFLITFAKEQGCDVKVDKVGNIHAIKGRPKLCLQAHYDMVCVGQSCNGKIKLIEQDGWLSAEDSTLGADNGIGVAIAMSMMEEFSDIECLFSADEEVGLIGANNCEHEIVSAKLLNLDSEDDSEVIIGCAASFNASITHRPKLLKPSKKRLFKAQAKGFLGGHSGIDIAKGIKSALVQMCRFIHDNEGELVSLQGGERSNSISVNASAVFYADEISIKDENISYEEIPPEANATVLEPAILRALAGFKQGVYEVDLPAQFVLASANLSTVKADSDEFSALIMARANSKALLEQIASYLKANFAGFTINLGERDEPWEPIQSEFSQTVLAKLQAKRPNAKTASIHAGLECGVFKARQPHLECASIGPNICAPHSVHERCELASVALITEVVRDILNHYQKENL